ncbi:hypothetical protein LINPERHAP1_LOCUS39704 [Linum perenne]
MQIGGFTLKRESTADGMVQIPSPHINPDATAPPKSSESFLLILSQTNNITVPTNMSTAK